MTPPLTQPPVIRQDGADQSQTHGELDVRLWPETSRNPERRLGAHRDLDRRRYGFAVEVSAGWLLPPQTVEWPRYLPILNQGNCAGAPAFAIVGALGTEPLLREDMKQIPVPQPPPAPPSTLFDVRLAQYTTELAVSIYGQATHLDDVGGTTDVWPKSDPGTTGDAVCQVVRNMGLITGWGHVLGATGLPHALQMYGPLLIGLAWHEAMDEPDVAGTITAAGAVRGGNMLLCRGYEHGDTPESSWYWLDSNWGTGFGVEGKVRVSAATMADLYAVGEAHAIALKTGNPRA